MDREYAEITPAVLRWARERAGYAVEAVARKLKVKGERVAAWEDGSQPLTFGRLEALAAMFKRPTALFFLPAPPDEAPPVVPDFRAAAGLSPELIYQLRRAVERRDVALALAGELDEAVSRFPFECDRHEPPEDAGARLRAVLSVRPDEHLRWNGDANAALNGWKDAAERSGVLVFQASRKELADARGVSLHFDPLALVVLASDPPAGRCFTLAHELAHLGLRHGGICDLHDGGEELFCMARYAWRMAS